MREMRKRKGGFSIAEVVVALAVIVIVSTAGFSILQSSISAKVATVNETEAQSFADNVWECFKVSNDAEEFASHVFFATGITLTDPQTDGDVFTYSHTSEAHNFTAQIKVRFPEAARSEFFIDVSETDGDSIVSFSYRKGDGT